MKVAIVIHDINFRGGQERSTLEIVRGLSREFECHVFASSAEDLPDSVIFHRVPVLLRRPLFVKDFFFRVFASLLLSLHKFDLIHATGPCVFRADIFTLQFIHKRWNRERHRLSSKGLLRRFKESFQAKADAISESLVLALNPSATYIAISDQVRTDLTQLYHLRNIIKIRHGVNLDEFSPAKDQLELRKHLGLPIERKLLLFVGAFERKGLFFLLNALGSSFTLNSSWDLIVIGEGPVSLAKELCRTNKIESRVHFLGSKKNVAEYYAAADLFILPSLYDPFGLVAIEALAAGTPIIVSQDSGSFDLLSEGQNGWGLRNGSDVEELKRVINSALESQAQLLTMRSKARASVQDEFWNKKIAEYVSTYRSLEKTH